MATETTSEAAPAAPPRQQVDTRRVAGRRELHFAQISDVVAEAERLSAGPYKVLGNWSFGQILMHLARSIDASIDGSQYRAPLPMRLVGRYVLKGRMLRGPLPAGFKLPAAFARELVPGETSDEAGLKALREAAARLATTDQRKPHPAMGPMSQSEWDQLHLRHGELHLGFVLPERALPRG